MRGMMMVAMLLGGAAVASWGIGVAQEGGGVEPEGVFSVSPVGAGSCLAVRLPLPKTQALAGVRWYNNDGTSAFRRLVAAEGMAEGDPQVEGGLTVAEGVEGLSSGWSEVTFVEPVACAAKAVDVIFEFAEGAGLTSRGSGGGAGFGYVRLVGGPKAFVSDDGQEWVRLLANCRVLVEPVLVDRQEGTLMLGPSAKASVAGPPTWTTALLAPRPNPGNPGTTISFTLAREMAVELVIYDLRGRQVATLMREPQAAGRHDVFWQGRDGSGRRTSSGVYFARLKAGKETFCRRLVMIK